MKKQALLAAVVVTALGQTTQQRSLGTAQQSVKGAAIVNAKASGRGLTCGHTCAPWAQPS